jgi:WD40 repeat protein
MRCRIIPIVVLALAPTAGLGQEKPARVDQQGDPLPPGALARLGTVRLRQPDWIRSMAVSPDGKTLASAGESSIRLWEIPSGRPLKKFSVYRDKADPRSETASAVAFTAKGELVALGNHVGKGCVLYEPESGKKLQEIKAHSINLLSGDGTFAVLSSENRLALWDLSTAKEVHKVPSLDSIAGPRPAALSADGKTLATSGTLGLRRVDLPTGKDLPRIGAAFDSSYSLAFSRDGKRLAAARHRDGLLQAPSQDINCDVVLWDTESGKQVRALKTLPHYVTPLALSADGKLLAVGLGDMTYAGGRTIALLDTTAGKEIDRPTGHEAAVESVAFVAGTDTIVSACEHGKIRTWDATTGKPLRDLKPTARLLYPDISPDGKLAVSSDLKRIHLRDLATDKTVRTLEHASPGHLRFSPDAKLLVASGDDEGKGFRIWETATGKELTEERVTGGWATAISADGKLLVRSVAAKLPDCRLEIVELPSGKKLRHFMAKYDVGRLAISPENKFLASSDRDQTIALWDLTEGKKLWSVPHPARDRGPGISLSFACPIAFSPDGKLLASGGDDHTVRLWDVATGKELRKFTGHEGTVQALAFSADGKRLATASEDTTVLIWDVATK